MNPPRHFVTAPPMKGRGQGLLMIDDCQKGELGGPATLGKPGVGERECVELTAKPALRLPQGGPNPAYGGGRDAKNANIRSRTGDFAVRKQGDRR